MYMYTHMSLMQVLIIFLYVDISIICADFYGNIKNLHI